MPTPDTCNVKDSKVGLTHSQLCDASTSAGNVDRAIKQVIDATCFQLGMSSNFARVLDKESSSRNNWPRNLFSTLERESSNVMGLKGKNCLEPSRIVRSLTFCFAAHYARRK